MRFRFGRSAALAASVVGLLALVPAPAALAAPVCSDSACVTLTPPSDAPVVDVGALADVTFSFTASANLGDTTFSATVGSGVRIYGPNGVVVDGGFIDKPEIIHGTLHVPLSSHGEGPDAGSHTIAFSVRPVVPAPPGADYDVTGTLAFRAADEGSGQGPQKMTSATTTVAVQDPGWDIDTTLAGALLARPASWVSFSGAIDTGQTVQDGTLTIDLPSGLGTGVDLERFYLLRDGHDRLPCAAVSSSQVTCTIPPQGGGSMPFTLFVPTDTTVPVGTDASIGLTVDPVTGEDPDRSDNSASVPIHFVAASSLKWTFTRSATKLAVGDSADVVLTIQNTGSTTTPQIDGHFTYAPALDGEGAGVDLGITGPGLYGGGGVNPFHAGPLAPGESAVYDLHITGMRAGVDQSFIASDFTYSAPAGCFDDSCFVVATTDVQITGAPGSGTGGGGPTGPPGAPGSGGGLANTGATVAAQLTLSGALLVAGLAFAFAGRRRRSS